MDLQAILNQCYERGRFAQQINYLQPPDLPLHENIDDWTDTLLREHGLHP